MKKIAAVLALLLCLTVQGAFALEMTGLETESVTREWESSAFFTRMEALTGVHVDAKAVYEKADYQKLLERLMRGETVADALFKAELTREQETELLDAGAIIDLAPLIDEHMPNLSALLAEHPEWREVMTLEDGRIASLPLLNRGERQVCVWINRAWLEKLGLSMPQTVEELTEALLAIMAGDPNGNGKRDEVGADLIGVYEMRWLLPYFGIVADDYNLARDESGEIVFAPEVEGYYDFISLLVGWTQEGILPAEAFTGAHSTLTLGSSDDEDETVVSGLVVSIAPYTNVPVSAAKDYDALLMPGPDGKTVWRDLLGEVWTGCFAVTSSCSNPGEALAWADALYGREGALLGYAGQEGEDYAFDADGRWTFITDGARSINDIRSQALMYTGSTMPGLAPTEFLMQVNSAVDVHVLAQNAQVKAAAQRVTQPYCLSSEEQARADALSLTLGRMVDEGIARFATGEQELTPEAYAAWLDALREAGSGELAALFAGKN